MASFGIHGYRASVVVAFLKPFDVHVFGGDFTP